MLALAHDLAVRLPLTAAALAEGVIDAYKAQVIAEATRVLDDSAATAAEGLVVPDVAGKTPGQGDRLSLAWLRGYWLLSLRVNSCPCEVSLAGCVAVPDGSTVNATVIAAAVGAGAALIVGVLAQLWSGHRENVRWSREKEDREKLWQRERQDRQEQWQREDSLCWHQDRQQAYARLIAALNEWDNELRRAVAIRQNEAKFGEEREIDTTEIERRATAARETLPLVLFMEGYSGDLIEVQGNNS
jgi:hypothetical protein